MSYTNEVKGQLARLLATENLVVEHQVCETASFDVERRVLTLPIWSVSDRVYNLLVGHEVGHALFTPNLLGDWECPKSYVNVTEDARVEKFMKRKYPGLAKDFYQGYQQLNETDFFGILQVDIRSLKLIDRINLHYKLGACFLIPFENAQEESLCALVGASETFDEALGAAVAIYAYQQVEEKEKIDAYQQGKTDDSAQIDTMGTSENSSPPCPGDTTGANSAGESDKIDDAITQEIENQLSNGGLESITDKNLSSNLNNLVDKSSHCNNVYLEIPKVDINHVVVDAAEIFSLCENYWQEDSIKELADYTWVDSQYRNFKNECAREVSFLAKEFEMKKSASSYARETVSRTGILDTQKLFNYKFSEDIFKKITVKTDGKNHGLIFYLDWSGSMSETIHATFKQLLSLCIFCRKVSIPFEVYAFVNDASFPSKVNTFNESMFNVGDFVVPEFFHLLNILSSSHNNVKFDKYAKYIWRCTMAYNFRYGSARVSEWKTSGNVPDTIPRWLYLNGTPLNESIATLKTLIPTFQRKYGLEKVHVSILTDGEACWSQRYKAPSKTSNVRLWMSPVTPNTVIRDRNSGKMVAVTSISNRGELTSTLLNYIKECFPSCNILGFRIASTRDVNNQLDNSNLTSLQIAKTKQDWVKNKSCVAKILGYQELYYLSQKGLDINAEFCVGEDATKSQIKSAFQKSLKSKANNKKILSSFISQIS